MKPTRASPNNRASAESGLALRCLACLSGLVWWLCLRAYASRWITLLNYSSTAVVSPSLEPLAPLPWSTFLASLLCLVGWIGLSEALWRRNRRPNAAALKQWWSAVGCLTVAWAMWLIDLAVNFDRAEALAQSPGVWGPSLWQPLWFAAFSGLAADRFVRALSEATSPKVLQAEPAAVRNDRLWMAAVYAASIACGIGWFVQSQQAFERFMLGFNDCGHFAQRIANTAAGRGWLIESPVLPAFWDHFNPGLTLLVPLWWIWPRMSLFFFLQALALAGSAPLVMLLARRLGANQSAASVWALAWLAQPVLGQMNIAYTYGWHPISLAIPLLLASLCAVLAGRWVWALLWAVLASSFEEGVLVIIATTTATLGAIELASVRWRIGEWPVRRVSNRLSAGGWIGIAALATLGFVLIFRFSGLAEFQTRRFHTLGSSAGEVLLSPLTRPRAFWGLLLRSRNAIFLAGLLLPCYLPALARGWPLLLPAALPIGVLLVWDHLPAQSLAFHYPSTLLPVLWLAAIVGATAARRSWPMAMGALATCLVACFSFGQMPWSTNTNYDVEAITYVAESPYRRTTGSPDNQFAHEQLARIRSSQPSVLATGRLATHLVGARELETVGQFFERRERLADLDPSQHPLRRYEVLILDRLENFQQRPEQTLQLEREALAHGFRKRVDRYELVVLERE